MADVTTSDPDVRTYFDSKGMGTGSGFDFAKERADIEAKQQELEKKYQDVAQEEIGGLQRGMRERERLLASPIRAPQRPNLQNIPAAPKQQYADPMQAFGSPAVILASLGSLFTRHSMKVAMDGATAAINAYHKGDQEQLELQRQNWKDATEQALAQNRIELEKYNAAWSETENNVRERQVKMQAIAAGNNDQMMLSAIKSGLLDRPWQLLQLRQQQADKLEQTMTLYGTGARGNVAMQTFIQETRERTGRSPTAEELQAFTLAGRPPRSAPGMALQSFIEQTRKTEGREPTPEEIRNFSRSWAAEQSFGRTTGSQSARVESASNEVVQLIPQALESSRNLPRGKIVPINKLLQQFEQGTSDPAYNDFALANFSLINAYTRAMNPQGVPRIAERLEQHAIGILSTATDQRAYEVQVRRLWKEVQASKTAVAETREGVKPGDINAPVPGMQDAGWTTLPDGRRIRQVQ